MHRSVAIAVIGALMVATGMALITGCGGDTETVTVTERADATSQDEPSESSDAEIGAPGDAQLIDLSSTDEGELTVILVGSDFNPTPPEFPEVYPLEKGSVWANVELTVANTGDMPSRQSAIEYALLADDGTRVTAYDSNAFEPVISCCGSGYPGDAMQPGEKATGFVAFQVPGGVTPTTLRASDTLGSSSVQWALK